MGKARRTLQVSGGVNFPVDKIESSNEGGMFVKLWVFENREWEDLEYELCCGAYVTEVETEIFVGVDNKERVELDLNSEEYENDPTAEWEKQAQVNRQYDEEWFSSNTEDCGYSRSLLASVMIGSTGWSGFDQERGRYWKCTFDDLNEQGRAVVAAMQALYPNAEMRLLTFLDT